MTRYEQILNMTIEEMAKFIDEDKDYMPAEGCRN